MKRQSGWTSLMAALLMAVMVGCGGENIFDIGLGGTDGRVGSIGGSVTGDGVPLGGVPVILIDRDSTQTDALGAFRFERLTPGVYAVTIRVPAGFVLGPGDEMVRIAEVARGGVARVNWQLNRTAAGPF